MRPFCKLCNKNNASINYVKNGVTHYRSMCSECGKKKEKNKAFKPKWKEAGYNKKPTCDLCGFKSIYPSQITVYHIDGNLDNCKFFNLRSICLNCVEVVKRKQVNWKRGDLQVDY